jgi:hypothetical protein
MERRRSLEEKMDFANFQEGADRIRDGGRASRGSARTVRHGPDGLIALVVFGAFPGAATNVQIRVRRSCDITQAPLSRTVVGGRLPRHRKAR